MAVKSMTTRPTYQTTNLRKWSQTWKARVARALRSMMAMARSRMIRKNSVFFPSHWKWALEDSKPNRFNMQLRNWLLHSFHSHGVNQQFYQCNEVLQEDSSCTLPLLPMLHNMAFKPTYNGFSSHVRFVFGLFLNCSGRSHKYKINAEEYILDLLVGPNHTWFHEEVQGPSWEGIWGNKVPLLQVPFPRGQTLCQQGRRPELQGGASSPAPWLIWLEYRVLSNVIVFP